MTSPTARSAIAVAGLRKSFGDKVVLDGIDLQVAEGTIFALLGPNGAGKTTMVQILSTLIGADAGEVAVGGHDLAQEPDAVRAVIGVTGQFSAVDQLLTGEENLILMADLRHLDRAEGRRRAAELLDRFDLVEAARKPAGTYSGGMRRRLDLAMTLVGDPRIIFLDEPTSGLDPRSRRTMWQIIRDLVAGGVTIFLTTQYLEEADELADRIALLDNGRLVAEGTPDQLKRRIPGGHIRLRFAYADGLESAARMLGETLRDDEALTLQVPSDGSVESLRAHQAYIDGLGWEHFDPAEFRIPLSQLRFTAAGADGCQVAFVSGTSGQPVGQLLAAIGRKPVLTVTDARGAQSLSHRNTKTRGGIMEKIGFVGTGAMGTALLSRLKLANVRALAFDIAPAAMESARAEGGRLRHRPRRDGRRPDGWPVDRRRHESGALVRAGSCHRRVGQQLRLDHRLPHRRSNQRSRLPILLPARGRSARLRRYHRGRDRHLVHRLGGR